jgi:hypothetical protein
MNLHADRTAAPLVGCKAISASYQLLFAFSLKMVRFDSARVLE